MKILSGTDGFKVSVEKALDDIDPKWRDLPGLIITGTHAAKDIDLASALAEIRTARESGTPTLGVCFGLHLGAVEFARNVLGLLEANTTELDPNTINPVVTALPGMRTGIRPVLGVSGLNSMENHWHQYRLNPLYAPQFANHFKSMWTQDADKEVITEEMHLIGHPHFVLVQYHPEYNSTPSRPHRIFINFLKACKTKM